MPKRRPTNCRPFPRYPRNSHARTAVRSVGVADPLTGSRPTARSCVAGPPWRSKSQVTSLGWRVCSCAPRRILRLMRFASPANGGAGPDRDHHRYNPKARSYQHRPLRDDRQHHGRWPACRPELKARSAPPMRPNLAAGSSAPPPRPTREVEQEPRNYGEALHQLHGLRLTK